MRDVRRWSALVAVILLAQAVFAAAACGGGSSPEPADAVYQQYFAKLSPAVAALDQRIPTLDVSGKAEPSALATALRSYDDALNGFAADLDKVDAPGKAGTPHKNWAKASREVAKAFDSVAARLAQPSHTPTDSELSLSLGGTGAVIQWVAACERLQSLGTEKGVPLDFKCATTLGIGSVQNN